MSYYLFLEGEFTSSRVILFGTIMLIFATVVSLISALLGEYIKDTHKARKTILSLLVIFPLFFIFLYRSNPHCSQIVSFPVALFDMNPHSEEKDGIPIYEPKTALFYRIILGIQYPLFLFIPFVFSFARKRLRENIIWGLVPLLFLATCLVMGYAWSLWGGERATHLADVVIFNTLFGYSVLLQLMGYEKKWEKELNL